MLKPSDIKNYEFKQAGRNAYKAEDVDSFFGEVVVNYEKMFRENAELIKRISLLADKLEQYKNDEGNIKQAVLSAQKAADIIVRDAEESVEDIKAEAEATLAAAKGEAEVIKSDAEKQAIADSDLLLSMAKDKAEDILNKAKEKAHGILIAANDSASDTVGAANRTMTSESLHYEMLKKEVSDFRASILAQYKAHIELISKLPELAVEEAEKLNINLDDNQENEDSVKDEVEEIAEMVDSTNEKITDNSDVLEYIEIDSESEEPAEQEEVIKTELPYDFFEENSTIEFVEPEEDSDNTSNEPLENDNIYVADIPISRPETDNEEEEERFTGFDNEYAESAIDEVSIEKDSENVNEEKSDADNSNSIFFDAIQNIECVDDEAEEEPKHHGGFFKKHK